MASRVCPRVEDAVAPLHGCWSRMSVFALDTQATDTTDTNFHLAVAAPPLTVYGVVTSCAYTDENAR